MFCLVVPEKYKDTVLDEDVTFCCPGCHELEDQETRNDGKRAFLPYWVSLTSLTTISDQFLVWLSGFYYQK